MPQPTTSRCLSPHDIAFQQYIVQFDFSGIVYQGEWNSVNGNFVALLPAVIAYAIVVEMTRKLSLNHTRAMDQFHRLPRSEAQRHKLCLRHEAKQRHRVALHNVKHRVCCRLFLYFPQPS